MENLFMDRKKQVLGFFFVFFTISVVSLILLASSYYFEEKTNEHQPVSCLVVEPKILDFHEVKEEICEGVVHLINKSDKKINLLFTESTCSCSSAQLPVTELQPNEKISLNCTLKTTGKKGLTGGIILVAYKPEGHEADAQPSYVPVQLKAKVIHSGECLPK
ncbi:MAG: hypothetical protein LBQ54_12390 [Planctomycetaceae bacterium]|jgi:hypothetical protein|nr:hypothetical protein [Planctomycetaceae bacterium]